MVQGTGVQGTVWHSGVQGTVGNHREDVGLLSTGDEGSYRVQGYKYSFWIQGYRVFRNALPRSCRRLPGHVRTPAPPTRHAPYAGLTISIERCHAQLCELTVLWMGESPTIRCRPKVGTKYMFYTGTNINATCPPPWGESLHTRVYGPDGCGGV